MRKRVVVLAGHRWSLATVAMLEALAVEPTAEVVGVISVREWTWRRIRGWWRRFRKGLWRRIGREIGVLPTHRDPERETFVRRVAGRNRRPPRVPQVCRRLAISFRTVPSLNSARAHRLLEEWEVDYAIYTGGGILRPPFIERVREAVLNVHCAPLPHVRGMSGVEWSLFLGMKPTATVHRIDAGIDTGRVYASRTLQVERGEPLGAIRARAVLDGIDLLTESFPAIVDGRLQASENPTDRGRQYFQMTDLLRDLVQAWIDQGVTPSVAPETVDPDDVRAAPHRRHFRAP